MNGAVPVAVFAYNRPDLLAGTLACLRDAGARSLFVFSDGPRSAEDEERVAAVRETVQAIDWTTPTLVARERNLGLDDSMRSGLDWMLDRHERVVVIEDDVAVAPEFYSYVTQALEAYAHEEAVAGVTGLRMPFGRAGFRGYPYDAFLLPRFFSLGWATWRRAWKTFDFDRDNLISRLRAPKIRPELGGADLPRMIRSAVVNSTLTGAWDVYCAANMIVNGQHFVIPTWNMVENTGLASGTHPMTPRWRLRWEVESRPDGETYRFPPPVVDERILKCYRIFTENPRGWTYRRLVPRPARMVLRRVRGTYEIFR